MSASVVLERLRRFLLILSVMLFGGALTELWLVGHTEDKIQWIAFFLATVGALAALGRLFRLSRGTVRILRVVMSIVILGSVFGIYEHLTGNIEFEREVHPTASTATALWKGLQGGNPLLAPGVLAIAAILALSATYRSDINGS